jgi:hypothetical protein
MQCLSSLRDFNNCDIVMTSLATVPYRLLRSLLTKYVLLNTEAHFDQSSDCVFPSGGRQIRPVMTHVMGALPSPAQTAPLKTAD